MLFDDAIDYGQAKTGALAGLLGGKEWLENPRQIFRVDARPGVTDRQADKFPGPGFGMGFNAGRIEAEGLRGNDKLPALGHGFAGVDD